jgi:uncharacterized protein YbjQ (UPF0145 family)
MIVVTTNDLPGHRVDEVLGEVQPGERTRCEQSAQDFDAQSEVGSLALRCSSTVSLRSA